ncbi:hypothetical protein GGR54DRAFT_253349 [Hypoxylon sp. NC1633]|nr:hypothetical protein GGR54DRAFT_253349 [Hypoxylon sp. NC1633]
MRRGSLVAWKTFGIFVAVRICFPAHQSVVVRRDLAQRSELDFSIGVYLHVLWLPNLGRRMQIAFPRRGALSYFAVPLSASWRWVVLEVISSALTD